MNENRKRKFLIATTVDVQLAFHEKLICQLSQAGHSVYVVSSGGPKFEELGAIASNYALKMVREPNLWRDAKSFVKWFKLIRRLRPDAVLIGTPKASLLGMISALVTRVPVRIYFMHGLRLETASGFVRGILYLLELITCRSATSIIAVGPTLKDKVIRMKLVSRNKVTVIGAGSAQGIDLEQFRPPREGERKEILNEVGLKAGQVTIGFVGRLTAEKGIRELGEAIIKINSKSGPVQVLAVGEVEDQAGRDFLQMLSLNNVKFAAPGYVEDPSRYFRAMDVFCLPSYREGLPTVVLEAFASSVPVVATNVTGIVDLVKDGITGTLVPAADSQALMNALDRVLSDPGLSETLCANARMVVTEKYDSNQIVSQQLHYLLKETQSNVDGVENLQ